MEFSGEVAVGTDKATLWEMISDPEVLVACVPGAEEVEQVSETTYRGTVKRSLAGVTVSMDGEVELVELDEPDHVTANATAEDDRTGSFMDATAEMDSRTEDGSTVLSYEVDMEFTGRLATLGTRILKRKIDSDIGTFFDNVRDRAEAD